MEISKDSFATMLLCSNLALAESEKPYTAIQWYKLAEKLWANKLTPKDLFDLGKIKELINIDATEYERIFKLLDRAGQFGVALSSLNEKGIFTLTKSDANYPARLKGKLKKYAPPVLYYSGNLGILDNPGIAIVGSRNVNQDGLSFTEALARNCVNSGVNIVSGGARGVDSIAENTSNSEDGTSLIFMADSLEKKIRNKDIRKAIMRNETLVMSVQRPDMPFKVYTAMDRNKYIYAMADYVVVVSSDVDKGGTWTGATENLKNGWTPLFVRDGKDIPAGNKKLLEMEGVAAVSISDVEETENIFMWFGENVSSIKKRESEPQGKQMTMFDLNMIDEN